MSNKNSFYIAIFLMLTIETSGFCQAKHEKTNIPLLPAGPAWGALWQQHAAEYKALTYQAYNLARIRIDQFVANNGSKPKAIITDIDETVLDNSPYFIRQVSKRSTYTDSSWINWTAEVRCDTVPGAYQFFKYVQSKGITVFYVTNRFQVERVATLKNLQKYKLPNADSTHLFLLKNSNSSKESRRKQVLKDYDVLLYLGDNLGDFSKLFDDLSDTDRNRETIINANQFGNHFIVFPNAMYGAWEDKLYPKTVSSEKDKNALLNRVLHF
jgi:5'-nucleotidase (lipoprotein e(P4) family)